DCYEIPPANRYATHITRSKELLDDAIKLANRGSYVDMTADSDTGEWLTYYKEKGGDMNHLTISSDAYGSLPKFDEQGKMVCFGVASTRTLYEQVTNAVKNGELTLEEILPLVMSNTADVLKLSDKGRIIENNAADIVVLDKRSLDVDHVFAKGRHMLKDKEIIVKGTFEN